MPNNKQIMLLLAIISLFLVACNNATPSPTNAERATNAERPANANTENRPNGNQLAAENRPATEGLPAIENAPAIESLPAAGTNPAAENGAAADIVAEISNELTTNGTLPTENLSAAAPPAQLNNLQEKLATTQPDGNGSVTITISDDELTQLIATAQTTAAQQGQQSAFQDATFTFTNGQIIFAAAVDNENLTGDIEVTITPYLAGNVLQFDIVSATVNGRSVPPNALQPIEDNLNNALQQLFSQLPPNISLDTVTVQEGTITITGSVTR